MLEPIDFQNTEQAYKYLDNYALMRAQFLFSAIDKPVFAKWGQKALQLAFQLKFPISALVRRTLFAQFCGGESLESCKKLIEKLQALNVDVVLDYAVESSGSEQLREKGCLELLNALEFLKAAKQHFAVFKPTAIMSSKVLEKLSAKQELTAIEMRDYEQGKKRARRIIVKASELGLSVLIDAEESWFQTAIDVWVEDLMQEFNKERAVVYHTVQLYRKDRLNYVKTLTEKFEKEKLYLGFKFVRGAYMEQEAERALAKHYENPIHDSKENCDRDYDESLEFCLSKLNCVSLFVGTHNEVSTSKLVEHINETQGLERKDSRIVFSQLFGMSDGLTFNLAKAGFNVVKYLPYGPVSSAIPYLIRRAQENTFVQGQMNRELHMIQKEIKRRKLKNK